jgi:hypothetical protein
MSDDKSSGGKISEGHSDAGSSTGCTEESSESSIQTTCSEYGGKVSAFPTKKKDGLVPMMQVVWCTPEMVKDMKQAGWCLSDRQGKESSSSKRSKHSHIVTPPHVSTPPLHWQASPSDLARDADKTNCISNNMFESLQRFGHGLGGNQSIGGQNLTGFSGMPGFQGLQLNPSNDFRNPNKFQGNVQQHLFNSLYDNNRGEFNLGSLNNSSRGVSQGFGFSGMDGGLNVSRQILEQQQQLLMLGRNNIHAVDRFGGLG